MKISIKRLIGPEISDFRLANKKLDEVHYRNCIVALTLTSYLDHERCNEIHRRRNVNPSLENALPRTLLPPSASFLDGFQQVSTFT